MGESKARRYRWLGTWHFWRTRGKESLQPIEPALKIAVIGTPAAHYLGVTAGWSVIIGVAFVVTWELVQVIAGWFDHRQGVIEAQQRWSNEQDPWKVETLALLNEIAETLRARP